MPRLPRESTRKIGQAGGGVAGDRRGFCRVGCHCRQRPHWSPRSQARVPPWTLSVTTSGGRDSASEGATNASSSLSPQIYLSWKSGPGEVKHWKDMIARPRQPVAQWHQLKA